MGTAVMMYVLPMLLGQTYDLGTERTGLQIFPPNVQKQAVRVEQYRTDSQYRMVENAAQVRDFLDVGGKLSLKIKGGMVDVAGEGSYLKESAHRTDGLEILVKLHFETVTYTLPSHVKPNADWSNMNEAFLGTHFCRSVTYGGDLVASVRLSSSNAFDRERIKGAISGGIDAKSFKANVQAKLEMLTQNAQDSSSLEIDYYASVPLRGVSHDVDGLMDLIENFPDHVKKVNNGTGNPLRMELYPLASLKEGFRAYFENRALTDELDDLETQFDDLRETRRKIGIWVTALPPITPEGVDEKIEQFTAKVNAVFGVYLQTIAELNVTEGADTQPIRDAFAAYRGDEEYAMPQKYVRMLATLQKEIYDSHPELKPRIGGALFTRWGRGECPNNATTEASVAGGVMTTSESIQNGASSDFLCATPNPRRPDPGDYFEGYPGEDDEDEHLLVSPVRYVGGARRFAPMSLQQVACATCRAGPRTAVLMKPGDRKCPGPEWTLEYTGVLMAPGLMSNKGRFVCVDGGMTKPEAEVRFGNTEATHLPELQEVRLQCGTLPCPPYEAGEPIPCVVCTI